MKNQTQKSKAGLYWAIGIVLGVIVAALLIWNSGIFQSRAVAATVGDQTFTVPELSYYYNAQISSKRQEAQMYAQFGMQSDYNTELAPEDQYYDEEAGVTYADYFLDQALEALRHDTILCTEAKNAGYTLSQSGQDAVASNLDALHMYSTQSGYSESAYLKLLYGQYMTKSMFKDLLTNSILADEYATAKQEDFTYSEDELNTYYEEHKADLDSYEYRYCYIDGSAQSTTDEEGNTVEPTEEESAAAMSQATEKTTAMVNAVAAGTPFNEAAAQAVSEADAASYEDPEYNHDIDILGSDLNNTLKSWLQDESRTPNEVTSLGTDYGFYVVQFLGREKSEDTYQTINYRDILVLSETTDTEVPVTDASSLTDTDSESADGTEAEAETETETVSLPSQEQLAAAEEEANSLLEQFNSGDKTGEAFGALAASNSDDETTASNGGLTENANKSSLSASLSDWLFEKGRQAGDTTILDYTDSSGRVIGYQILFVDSLGEIAWRYAATSALRADDYDAWFTETEENYPAELTEKGKAIAGTPDAEEAEGEDAEAAPEEAEAAETTEPASEEAEAAETTEPASEEAEAAETTEVASEESETTGDTEAASTSDETQTETEEEAAE